MKTKKTMTEPIKKARRAEVERAQVEVMAAVENYAIAYRCYAPCDVDCFERIFKNALNHLVAIATEGADP